MMRWWTALLWLPLLSGCGARDGTVDLVPGPDPRQVGAAPLELRDNLGAQEFVGALFGKWTSAYEHPSRPNVRSVEFRADGTATIEISDRGQTTSSSGSFRVGFERPPAPGKVTFARVTIVRPDGRRIVLSRVNFGLHNAVLASELLLRVDREPYGALRRVE